jgi:hypothetical protein
MAINRDPDAVYEASAELKREAKERGWPLVHVVLDVEDDADGPPISFWAITPAVPRIGDKIRTENKKYCQVLEVLFCVSSQQIRDGEEPIMALTPNVYAELPKEREEGDS